MTKTSIGDIITRFPDYCGKEITVEGRIVRIRKMKGYTFADIIDKGTSIQVILSSNLNGQLLSCGDLVIMIGVCQYSNSGEMSIYVIEYSTINIWKSEVTYKNIVSGKHKIYSSFLKEGYTRLNISYQIYNFVLSFFMENNFTNVVTPILCNDYNGGKSFPVTSHYLNKKLGYNRTTMEEKMQALIGIGFESIFQVGSIFRSDKEMIFIEGYSSKHNFTQGISLLKDLISHIMHKMSTIGFPLDTNMFDSLAKKERSEVKYHKLLENYFGESLIDCMNDPILMMRYLREKKFLSKHNYTYDTLADIIINKILLNSQAPIVVKNYPYRSSPLYALDSDDNTSRSLLRARMILPNQQGGFDVGMQENNFDNYIKRVKLQKIDRGEKKEDYVATSLDKVISCGLPSMFGFGINMGRLIQLRSANSSIEPF